MRHVLLAAVAAVSFGVSTPPAQAVDGCLLLMCLAAPKPKEIPMCAMTIRDYLHDAARGKPFPGCGGMSGQSNVDASNCPPQYITMVQTSVDVLTPVCRWTGVTVTYVDGQVFTRAWWNQAGESVIEYTPDARARLAAGNGQIDPTWDLDLAAWQAAQAAAAAAAPPPTTGGNGV